MNGETNLEQILEIVNNKAKYEKFLKDIKALRDETANNLALIGKAKEIESLHKKAAEALDSAQTVVAQAKVNAKAIEDKAATELEEKETSIAKRLEMLDRDEKAFHASKSEAETSIAMIGKDLDLREKRLINRERAAEKVSGEAKILLSEVANKMKILDQVVSDIS